MAKADKKAGNLSAEGAIASYVHFNSKLGVIVEVNSETDFVAINAIFKEFAQDVAMQIAANPEVSYVSVENVPADVMAREKEVEMAKEDLAGKPDNIREKIVEGRLNKQFAGLVPTTQLNTLPRSSPTNSVRWSFEMARAVTAAGSVLSVLSKAVCWVSFARKTNCLDQV